MKRVERLADLFMDHCPYDKTLRAQKQVSDYLFYNKNGFLRQLGRIQLYIYAYIWHKFQTEEEHKQPYCLVCKYPEFFEFKEIICDELEELIYNCDFIGYLINKVKKDHE